MGEAPRRSRRHPHVREDDGLSRALGVHIALPTLAMMAVLMEWMQVAAVLAVLWALYFAWRWLVVIRLDVATARRERTDARLAARRQEEAQRRVTGRRGGAAGASTKGRVPRRRPWSERRGTAFGDWPGGPSGPPI